MKQDNNLNEREFPNGIVSKQLIIREAKRWDLFKDYFFHLDVQYVIDLLQKICCIVQQAV